MDTEAAAQREPVVPTVAAAQTIAASVGRRAQGIGIVDRVVFDGRRQRQRAGRIEAELHEKAIVIRLVDFGAEGRGELTGYGDVAIVDRPTGSHDHARPDSDSDARLQSVRLDSPRRAPRFVAELGETQLIERRVAGRERQLDTIACANAELELTDIALSFDGGETRQSSAERATEKRRAGRALHGGNVEIEIAALPAGIETQAIRRPRKNA